MIYKCKMCGGELDIAGKEHICECPFCGVTQTIPNVDEEKTLKLFNRATFLLNTCEYDKASGIYEHIISDQGEQAEAFWGLCLCKYGIEYVDDPNSGKKIPTCHRTMTNSILKDSDYIKALELADVVSRKLYEEEAKYIDGVQKKILEISKSEEPYDVFICYKETDKSGRRTPDSVIAEEIFDALTEKGYKAFFSKISLEDKIGQEYEPYIFAALTSAKVMLAIGTREEYFNAPWVKNEWSRFLKLCNNGEKKYLIPCYKNMSPYEMPEEFVNLQAQDMGKLGYLQDLLKGIDKLITRQNTRSKNTSESSDSEIDKIIKDVDALIAKGDFKEAKKGLKKLDAKLDSTANPELYDDDGFPKDNFKNQFALYNLINFKIYNKINIEMYYGLEDFANKIPHEFDDPYLLECEWSDDKAFRRTVENFIFECKRAIKKEKYNEAKKAMNKAKSSIDFKNAYDLFIEADGFSDSLDLANYCMQEAIDNDNPTDIIKEMLFKTYRPNMSKNEIEEYLNGLKKANDSDFDNLINYLERKLNSANSKLYNDHLVELKCKKEGIISNNNDLLILNKQKEKLLEEHNNKKAGINFKHSKDLQQWIDKKAVLQSNLDDLNRMLRECGFFDFAKKKKIKQEIDESSIELLKLNNTISAKQKELKNSLKEELQREEDNYLVSLQNIEKQIKVLSEEIGLNKLDKEIFELEQKINISKQDNALQYKPKNYYLVRDKGGVLIPCLLFGKYPQIKVTSVTLLIELRNTKEDDDGIIRLRGLEFMKKNQDYYFVLPIKWRINNVKNIDGNKVFKLTSLYNLDFLSFNEETNIKLDGNNIIKKDGNSVIDYEFSDIRKWISNNFISTFFSQEEKEMLCLTSISNESDGFKVKNKTLNDYIFIPSEEEFKALGMLDDLKSRITYKKFLDNIGNSLALTKAIDDSFQNDFDEDLLDNYINDIFEKAKDNLLSPTELSNAINIRKESMLSMVFDYTEYASSFIEEMEKKGYAYNAYYDSYCILTRSTKYNTGDFISQSVSVMREDFFEDLKYRVNNSNVKSIGENGFVPQAFVCVEIKNKKIEYFY